MLTTSHPAGALVGRGAALVWETLAGHSPSELTTV